MHRSRLLLLVFLATSLAKALHGRLPRYDERIIGGIPVTIQDYPHQLSLLIYDYFHICGASIISPTAALTSARCIEDFYRYETEEFNVRAGSTYYNKGGQLVRIKSINIHPRYDGEQDYDVAVVHLARSLTAGKPINLVDEGEEIYADSIATVSGWGLFNDDDEKIPKQLHAVNVSLVSAEACQKAYEGFKFNITDRMLCAGYADGGRGACTFDQGGPLIVGNKQIGIFNSNYRCGLPGYPDIYTKISSVRSWIREVSGV